MGSTTAPLLRYWMRNETRTESWCSRVTTEARSMSSSAQLRCAVRKRSSFNFFATLTLASGRAILQTWRTSVTRLDHSARRLRAVWAEAMSRSRHGFIPVLNPWKLAFVQFSPVNGSAWLTRMLPNSTVHRTRARAARADDCERWKSLAVQQHGPAPYHHSRGWA